MGSAHLSVGRRCVMVPKRSGGSRGLPDDVFGGLGPVLAGIAAGPDREIGGAKQGAPGGPKSLHW